MRAMRESHLDRIEIREEVQRAYNEDVQRRLDGTVWNAGRCASWYLDENGDNPAMWPDFTFRFRRLARRFDLGDYEVSPLAAAAASARAGERAPADPSPAH